ncbi:hypothetical protein HGB07_10180 [Candidatus Roizmanbacteria bacterium]|nr:hypothetical protein [Candidatus Roizmanbacteria bacterium]
MKERTGCKIFHALKAYASFATFPMMSRYLDGVCASGLNEARLGYEEFKKEVHTFSAAYRGKEINAILTNKEKLHTEVDITCRDKYSQIRKRLQMLAVRSLIYIFLTKTAFAIILEYPISLYLFNEARIVPIIINSLFPPFLMLVILALIKLPNDENTQNIYQRIIDIIDKDKTYETKVALLTKKSKAKKSFLAFGFTIFYSSTFFITLFLIYQALSLLNFNIISQAVFIFFISVVSFFSYRIKGVTNEYRLVEKDSAFTPVVDFFFMPILSIGKFLSTEISKLNFFIVIFDFIIEAPFKLLIEIVEEWISFVKARKEEIV